MPEDNSDDGGVVTVLRDWMRGELDASVSKLDALTHASFRLVGPAGFVLDKPAWLQRYHSGDLRTTRLTLDDVDVRVHGSMAATISVQRMAADYRGHPAGGVFRTTHVLLRRDKTWQLLGQHLSPITDPAVLDASVDGNVR